MHGTRSAAPTGPQWNAGPLPLDELFSIFQLAWGEKLQEIDRLTGQNVFQPRNDVIWNFPKLEMDPSF